MKKESLIHKSQLLEYENDKLNSKIGEQKSKKEKIAIRYANLISINKQLKAIFDQLRTETWKQLQRMKNENKRLKMKITRYKSMLMRGFFFFPRKLLLFSQMVLMNVKDENVLILF